jgi:anti-anti-sigma factor
VAAHATEAGLSGYRADDLVIAAHELAANVVRHGSGRGRLRIWTHRRALHCQVTDEGAAQEADTGPGEPGRPGPAGQAAQPGAGREPDRPPWKIQPGHGLWLVRQLADRTSIHPGPHGTAVTISFRLGPADGRPFTLSQHARGACTVLAVSGQLDLNSAGQLTEAVSAQLTGTDAPCLVIDLGELVSWDVFGVAALLRAQAQADAGPSAQLVLADVPGPLQHHLTETGLASRFTISDTAGDGAGDSSPPQSGRAQQGGLSPQP